MPAYKFHQFVVLDRGPCNTAIIDLLKGDVFQATNRDIAKFEEKKYDEIPSFIDSLLEAGLVIEVDDNTWIPRLLFKQEWKAEEKNQLPVILEIEEGVDWKKIESLFANMEIKELLYFGENYPGDVFPGVPVNKQKKDFSKCISRSSRVGKFSKVDENFYRFSREYNNCWGRKIALTRDGKIHPCIYSEIELGEIDTVSNSREIIDKAWEYWLINRDKVEKCKVCEFRYICPDCREIAIRSGGSLYSTNPYCRYDPYSGTLL